MVGHDRAGCTHLLAARPPAAGSFVRETARGDRPVEVSETQGLLLQLVSIPTSPAYKHVWKEQPMPARRTCAQPGCPNTTTKNTRWCPQHTREKQGRQTPQQRGYGTHHRNLRKQWQQTINTTPTNCARCGQPITQNQPWDLGHNDTNRNQYNGPEHQQCNRGAPHKGGGNPP